MTLRSPKSKFRTRIVYGVLMGLSFQLQVHAADIANIPLATQASGSARANLMFIMDDSISMGNDYLPDSANYGNLCEGYFGTNLIFYNPNVVYTPPPRADGTLLPDATWPNAKNDGYSSSNTSTNLSNLSNLSTPTTRTSSASNNNTSKFYYATYKANMTPATPVCTTGNSGGANANYDWTKWDIALSLPVAQQTNYANWWSYYRTRMLAMRGAVGKVMKEMDATRFRVGYSAISDYQYSNGNSFLRIGEFNQGTQKADFYSRLYAAPTTGATPLRPALEKIGKYYAGRQMNGSSLPNGADPLQYSCQRNYAILTTDGFWNKMDEPNNYTPTRLDGSTAIGNPDSGTGVPRPRRDDGRTQGNNWTTGGSGVSNTLADIAMYYFETDLRDPAVAGTSCTGSIANQNVCTNDVGFESPPPNLPIERVQHQRMTTYALGLGVAGTLNYRGDYDTATSGDFYDIKQGNRPWPDPNVASTAITVPSRADDLWHAAVNGRGRYYSASNQSDLVTQLSDVLENISAATGTAAAAATSTQRPVSGDNFIYRSLYTTVLWEGNLKAFTVDPQTGAVSTSALWEAKNTLAAQTGTTTDSRNIYFRNTAVSGTQRASFTYTNLNAAGLGSYFTNACLSGNYKLSQCASLAALGSAVQTAANDGANLVNFLRGQRGKEDIAANAVVTDRLFRGRPNTPLGDIVNAAPVYVKKPPFRYADTGYNTFASNNATRQAVVYVAANDGMLHAFNADNGNELWAYVPTAVMSDLWRLADNNYDTSHRYFVDATPVVGDVFDGTNWRTILVGGLGAGGRAYYALDVTNPANPISLWEFSSTSDNDLGLTYGNPVITKNKAGTWVVAFSSGYNNVSPGNGNGHLYIRNAVTGAAIDKISTYTTGTTPAGTTATPSELGKINAWVNDDTNNTAARFYAGDMLGYMWRFDFDNNIAPNGKEAMLMGRAMAPDGTTPQPITTKPMLAKVGNVSVLPTVSFATGRYLGTSDIGDTTVQSVYALKETLGTTGLGIVRNNTGMVQQTLAATTVGGVSTRGVTNPQPMDWSAKNGWFVDFSLTPAGERVNVDMIQTDTILAVATNLPSPTACNPGGSSWLYFFDLTNGTLGGAGGNTFVAATLYTTLTAGINVIKTGDTTRIIRSGTDGSMDTVTPPGSAATGATVRRTSWRELIN